LALRPAAAFSAFSFLAANFFNPRAFTFAAFFSTLWAFTDAFDLALAIFKILFFYLAAFLVATSFFFWMFAFCFPIYFSF